MAPKLVTVSKLNLFALHKGNAYAIDNEFSIVSIDRFIPGSFFVRVLWCDICACLRFFFVFIYHISSIVFHITVSPAVRSSFFVFLFSLRILKSTNWNHYITYAHIQSQPTMTSNECERKILSKLPESEIKNCIR